MAEVKLREFLYVDVDRTRSLLAQMKGGVIQNLRSETGTSIDGGASVKLFGVGGEGGYGRTSKHEESRSMQDLIFAAFEEEADEGGFITDLDESFTSTQNWESGGVQTSLEPGQLVRMTCDVQVLDGGLFAERIARFDKMADTLVDITEAVPRNVNAKQKASLRQAAKSVVMGGMTSSQLKAISDFVEAFVGDSIAIRVLPAGPDHLEHSFSGALLGRSEYIQEEREHLFSRYGTVASRWTAVMQIAAIPTKPDVDAAAAPAEELQTTHEGGDINRAAMEAIAIQLLGHMESIGIVEGPRWPSVSVTPLGLYREVPLMKKGHR